MASYTSPRDMEMARRVRRMLIEQSCVLQDDAPDEFTWLTRHFTTEERFVEEELGAQIELRLGRWARAYWPSPPRNRELCLADVFELTTRKQTAYACLIRAFRSVRLLEGGEGATTFRFAELYRYVAEEGARQSPWLSFDETVIAGALASGAEDEAEEPGEDDEAATAARAKARPKAGRGAATDTTRAAPSAARLAAGSAQRARMNQRAYYQAFAAFERLRLLRRLGIDERQRPEEQFRYDERDFGGLYEFTDIIDRFLPPAALVQYDELAPEPSEAAAFSAARPNG